jgi:DNA-binding response OmpR family regulator
VKRKALRVVVGGGPGFAVGASERLRWLGWDVCTVANGDDLHALTARKNPAAVLIPVSAGLESGYLTCTKLRLTRPRVRVVLVGEMSPRAIRFAGFVGAGLTTEADAAEMVANLI